MTCNDRHRRTGVAEVQLQQTAKVAACVEVADLPDGGRLVRDTKDHGQGPKPRT